MCNRTSTTANKATETDPSLLSTLLNNYTLVHLIKTVVLTFTVLSTVRAVTFAGVF